MKQASEVTPNINYAVTGIYISTQGSIKRANAVSLQMSVPDFALEIL